MIDSVECFIPCVCVSRYLLLQNLESMIQKVMHECNRLQATSVAFPALGTGNLGFPEDVVAEVMVRAISSYLQQNPGTTVKKVLLVIFMDSTHKAFQRTMSGFPSLPSAPHPVEDDFELLDEEVDFGGPRASEVFAGPSQVLYSFSCNRVNVDVVNGDISADDSEGIVNTASETLTLHNFGVMGALRRKGGQQLQDECNKAVAKHGILEHYKVIVTGVGNRGVDGLKCRKILHVLAPQHSNGLAKTVSEALKCADKEGLRSVALPAIGTGEHGFSSAEAAEGIADGIVQFSKSVHESVASIKVILFQREQFGNFARAFEEAGKKKGFLRRLYDKVARAGTAVQSFLDMPSLVQYTTTRQPAVAPVPYSDTVLCIKVYAGDTSAIDRVFQAVDEVIAETIQEECVKNDKINKLSAKAEAELERQAETRHVRISIDKAPLNQVCFNGERADVLAMKNALMEELRIIENEEKREKEAELLTSKLQWQWKDANGDFQNYGPMTNLKIEEAFSEGRQSVRIHTEEGPRTVNFKQMSELQVHPPYNFTTVKRRDYDKERKEGEHPLSWEPMPKDPSTGREVECHVVMLSSRSQEYKDVAAQFESTMGMGGVARSFHSSLHLLQGQAIQGRIVKIERIQNSKLYEQYSARKKAMDRANVGRQNERQLFHGCSLSAVDAINHGGFNRSYAGQHGECTISGVVYICTCKKYYCVLV